MDVRIHLRTSVFQRAAEMLEYILHRRRVSCCNGPGGGNQRFTLQSGVLMEDENGKNVAE